MKPRLLFLLVPAALAAGCGSTTGPADIGVRRGGVAATIPIDDVPDGRATPPAPPRYEPYERPVTESRDVNPARRP